MNITRNIILCCLLVSISLAMYGCGSKADESKPIGEVQAEAEKMSVEKLKSMAVTYKDAIAAKKDEAGDIAAKLKEIPITKMMGDEAKELKADIDGLNKSLSALKERFEVYYNKLKEKGGDLSGLK